MILSCCVLPDPALILSSQSTPLQLMDSHFDNAEAASTRADSERLVCSQFKNNHFTEMCCVTEAGSYLRLIDSCITQLKEQGPF